MSCCFLTLAHYLSHGIVRGYKGSIPSIFNIFCTLVRIFRPVLALRFRYNVLRLRTFFKAPSTKEKEFRKWFESLTPVGVNPFEAVTTYKTWASESSFVLANLSTMLTGM